MGTAKSRPLGANLVASPGIVPPQRTSRVEGSFSLGALTRHPYFDPRSSYKKD
jgi:hypothetical protein